MAPEEVDLKEQINNCLEEWSVGRELNELDQKLITALRLIQERIDQQDHL